MIFFCRKTVSADGRARWSVCAPTFLGFTTIAWFYSAELATAFARRLENDETTRLLAEEDVWREFLFRLDLYWNVPLASMVDYMDSIIPRFPITVGGYWWFQLGVGLGAVCIMALFFSAAMILTKNFYAGSAVSIAVPLFLMMMTFMEPNVTRNSLCMMSTPIGLYINAGLFLRPQMFLFSILPHFEGLSLLIWGGFAAILAVLGFVRFRKAAL